MNPASTPLTDWLLQDFPPGVGEQRGAQLPGHADGDWLPITAPGDVHRALIEAGRLGDPFWGTQELDAAWVQEREWWYRTAFEHSPARPGRLELILHGVDTFATVYLNGESVGVTANMFRTYTFDLTDRARPGTNVLALRFDRPLDHLVGRSLEHWSAGPPPGGGEQARVALRKAQYGFGWDWGPVLPTFGLWRAAELRRRDSAVLGDVQFRTVELSPDHRRALVAVGLGVEQTGPASGHQVQVQLTGPSGRVTGKRQPVTDFAQVYLELPEPQLWWTHDLGEPTLYVLDITLWDGTKELDRVVRRVGVRTIELDQSPDPEERGTRFFRFVLNGVPLFARGANWIPADSFIGTLGGEEGSRRYRQLLTLARGAHMNMLRVWGGGVYEHDAFYDLCDELGLLVWQDFMFACAMYPEDDAMAREVDAEARDQVRRLRNHACLALWCGNNENQWLYDVAYPERGDRVPGSRYYDEILPGVVRELDPATPYWPGSPYGGDDHNSMNEGDRHNWDVWHGNRPFRRRFGEVVRQDATPDGVDPHHYASDLGRFISEFGLHAAPGLETLQRVIPGDELFHHSPAMDHHNKDFPKNKGDNLMLNITGLPRDLGEYIDFSQVSQAVGLKLAIEHYRRRLPHCSGALIWQLNDCWPCLSWSLIDYHGLPKAAYYAVRRAFAPVLASFRPLEEGGVELWITNDTRLALSAQAEVSLETLSGEQRWLQTLTLEVPPQSSRAVWRTPARAPAAEQEVLWVRAHDHRFESNHHLFGPLHGLELTQPTLGIRAVDDDPEAVEVSSDTFVPFVHLDAPHPVVLDDNDFALGAGERRTVRVAAGGDGAPGLRARALRVAAGTPGVRSVPGSG